MPPRLPRRKRAQNTGSVPITPRKDGRYEARLTLPDGTRKSFYGKTWREAEQKLNAARRDLEQGKLPAPGRATVDDLWREYVTSNPKGLRHATLHPRRYRWAKHVSPVIGSVKLSQLSSLHVQRVVTVAQQAGLSVHTVFSIYSLVKAVLQQGVRWQLLPANPAVGLSVPQGEARSLPLESSEQVSAFLSAIEGCPYACAILMATGLGLRSVEVRGLRWRDVDLDRGVLHVRHGVDVIDGVVVFGPLKTASSRRDLPLPAFVADALRAQRPRVASQRLRASRWEDHDLVVPGRFGRPVTVNTLIAATKAISADAGVPPLVFHHLRHLCATILLTRGVPVNVAQRILGHSSPKVTLSVYAHVNAELLDGAALSMDDAFRGLREGSGR